MRCSAGTYGVERRSAESSGASEATGETLIPPPAHRTPAVRTGKSGGAVRVGVWQLAGLQVAEQGRHRTWRVDARAVSDALPHHPTVGCARVDDGRGDGRHPFDSD